MNGDKDCRNVGGTGKWCGFNLHEWEELVSGAIVAGSSEVVGDGAGCLDAAERELVISNEERAVHCHSSRSCTRLRRENPSV